jgi:hypothetical protein
VKIEVPYSLRGPVRALTVAVPLIGLVVSALTLPPIWALAVTGALSIISWLLNRFVFRYVTLFVMAPPTDEMEQYWLGTAWSCDPETLEGTTLALVYLNRDAARDCYQMLRTWSLGKRVDTDGHIRISIVDEGDSRYSLFVMAGMRQPVLDEVAEEAKRMAGRRAVVHVHSAHPFLRNCVDYSDRPQMQRVMEAIPFQQYLGLEASYVHEDQIRSYSKQRFQISDVAFRKREELPSQAFETELPWEDLRAAVPDYFENVAARIQLGDT